MLKRIIAFLTILGVVFTVSVCLAQDEKTAVKLNTQVAADNWIGNRLIAHLKKEIAASPVLKPAGEDSVMLICDLLLVKVENRPSCAYSLVVTGNAYGKVTPVLLHRLGIFGKNAIRATAQGLVQVLEEQARSFQEQARKGQE